MDSASPRLQKLAHRLLVLERQSGHRSEEAAAFHVTEKLRQRLSMLTGAAGFRAVLARSLALAGQEVKWLGAIRVDARGSLEALNEVCARMPADEIARGEEALIAHLIGLLVTFIGASLTAYLLQDIWPEVSPQDLSPEMEENGG
ncbi:MAG TPA: hypothetical protein VFW28_17260 [Micropepsaceae bacterium]|nr:hypothetical protein [Micropepsaceae bacterium]